MFYNLFVIRMDTEIAVKYDGFVVFSFEVIELSVQIRFMDLFVRVVPSVSLVPVT